MDEVALMQVNAEGYKFNKAEVLFESPSKGMDHCNDCKLFEVYRKHACKIVGGFIRPDDWCKRFERNLECHTRK